MNLKPKIILLHPTGNANVRSLAKALSQSDLLERFYTSIAFFKKSFLWDFLKFMPLKILKRRIFPNELKNYTSTHPFRETVRNVAPKLGLQKLTKHETGWASIDQVSINLGKQVSKRLKHLNADAVYAYEDAALEVFSEAKRLNIKCFYDLPIGYWRAARELMAKEIELRPDWAETMVGFKDSSKKLERKDKELELADCIFVASSFTKKSLELYPKKLSQVKTIPYGFPKVIENRIYDKAEGRKLKLLFVGSLSQRKGIANLIESVEHFQDYVSLTIVGSKVTENCSPLNQALKKHLWIPYLSHEEVLEQMRLHDIFVFPSLFEGYGLVIAEAMSQGTPVITTNRTCGADYMIDNENGWIVEPSNTESLTNKIKEIVNNKYLIEKVGREALKTAKLNPNKIYENKMVEELSQLM